MKSTRVTEATEWSSWGGHKEATSTLREIQNNNIAFPEAVWTLSAPTALTIVALRAIKRIGKDGRATGVQILNARICPAVYRHGDRRLSDDSRKSREKSSSVYASNEIIVTKEVSQPAISGGPMEELTDDREGIALEARDTQPDSALQVQATSERLFSYNRFMRDMNLWFLGEQRENARLMKDYIGKFRTIDANQLCRSLLILSIAQAADAFSLIEATKQIVREKHHGTYPNIPAKKLEYTKSELEKWFVLAAAVRSEFSYYPIHDHLADVLGVAGDDDLTTAVKDCYKKEWDAEYGLFTYAQNNHIDISYLSSLIHV
ncbi:hypothetical protein FAGAP_4058 [Fusarium agapanthi]|uniref:Uncharacterized protein n=1 Tax=Fusarium agapanthi TaxID=1803897 RepID=A0A9P5EG76_9HYPO|nr:hypothetical protein FAGAP_4058 [Fusarium agapanthi]